MVVNYINEFIQAAILGISVAAPIGMNGLIVINKSLSQGRRAGLTAGAGAATMHGVWTILAIVGAEWLSGLLDGNAFVFKAVAALIMVFLAIKTATSKPTNLEKNRNDRQTSMWSCYSLTLSLSICNPLSILPFIGFAASSGAIPKSVVVEIIEVLGVFSGSMSWWFILSFVVAVCGRKLPKIIFRCLNYLSGAVMGGWAFVIVR
ncbi:MAG: LysE family translocator [Prochloraceae cyanobacterium]